MHVEALVQLLPATRTVDSIENVGPCRILPRQLTVLVQATIGTVARPPLRLGRKVVKALDPLRDVAVVMADNDTTCSRVGCSCFA